MCQPTIKAGFFLNAPPFLTSNISCVNSSLVRLDGFQSSRISWAGDWMALYCFRSWMVPRSTEVLSIRWFLLPTRAPSSLISTLNWSRRFFSLMFRVLRFVSSPPRSSPSWSEMESEVKMRNKERGRAVLFAFYSKVLLEAGQDLSHRINLEKEKEREREGEIEK